MTLSYNQLNSMSYDELKNIQRGILDKFAKDERDRQNLISDILRLQSLGSTWAINNKKQP